MKLIVGLILALAATGCGDSSNFSANSTGDKPYLNEVRLKYPVTAKANTPFGLWVSPAQESSDGSLRVELYIAIENTRMTLISACLDKKTQKYSLATVTVVSSVTSEADGSYSFFNDEDKEKELKEDGLVCRVFAKQGTMTLKTNNLDKLSVSTDDSPAINFLFERVK